MERLAQNMKLTLLDSQASKYSMRGTCPHCRRESVFMMVGAPHVLETTNSFSHDLRQVVSAMQCQGCLEYILGIILYNRTMGRLDGLEHYPLGKPNDSISEDVPEAIRSDFSEALRCRFVDAYNATVKMCHRALESSCI